MKRKRNLMSRLIVVILVLCIAYYLYIPIPDHAAEPWKERFTFAIYKVIGDISRLAEFSGYSPVNTIRKCLSLYVWINWLFSPTINDIKIEKITFDGVPVRIYYPTSARSEKFKPGALYFHGGGWVYHDADNYDGVTKQIANMSDIVTFFVEYRKAPEHIFPAAFDDCVKAVRHVLKNAKLYGVDPERIGLLGDSAGGNLVLAVSLKLSQEKDLPALRLQGLIYPTVQAVDFSLKSFLDYDLPPRHDNTLVTKGSMIFYVNMYAFGHLKYTESFANNSHISTASKKKYRKFVDSKFLPEKYQVVPNDDIEASLYNWREIEDVILNPYFAPLLMTDEQLRNVPKAIIMTCGLDGLRDEGFILAERMRRVDVPVVHQHYNGSGHGFIWLSYFDIHKESMNNLATYIRNNI